MLADVTHTAVNKQRYENWPRRAGYADEVRGSVPPRQLVRLACSTIV